MIENKYSYVDTNGYHIHETNISYTEKLLIKKTLNVSPKNFGFICNTDNQLQYKLYKLIKGEYWLPRYWAENIFGKAEKYKYKKNKIDLEFNGQLREKQQNIIDKSYKHIKKFGGGLISVGCGGGKTVMGIYLACKLKKKCLVVVHKNFLQDQWIERIKQFTNARVGIIRQDKCEIEDNDIVIASIQTISKRKFGKKIFKHFGFVIYDEAHHVSSKYFSKSLLQTNCKYTLALTATPYRKDGLIDVMYWFLGNCIYKDNVKINKNVIVKNIFFDSIDPLFKLKKKWLRIGNKGKLITDTGGMTTNFCKIESRNNLIVNIIKNIVNDDRRKILILSGRKEHLKILKSNTDKIMENNNPHNLTTCFYHGELSEKERKYTEKFGDIIFGTYALAEEGLDIPRLNTVIFSTSIKDITQSVGRILRQILQQGNVKPLVIDLVDNFPTFIQHNKERSKFYKKAKYNCDNYNTIDNEFIKCNIKDIVNIPDITEEDLVEEKEVDFNKLFENKCEDNIEVNDNNLSINKNLFI